MCLFQIPDENSFSVLQPGSSIICFSTVPPSFLANVQKRLESLGVGLCDSPVSGGSTRAAAGTLTVMTSGTSASIDAARPVLEALTRKPEGNLSVVGASCGDASNFKLINQVFCAGHIAAASESMAFGATLGLNPRMLYNIIRTCAGDSFMCESSRQYAPERVVMPQSVTVCHGNFVTTASPNRPCRSLRKTPVSSAMNLV